MKYRTKPFEIEAVQFHLGQLDKVKAVFPDAEFEVVNSQPYRVCVWDYLQLTWVTVNPGDYIIKGMKGEYYPCEQEVFEAKYEAS